MAESNLPVPRITMDFARRGSNTSIYSCSPSPTFLAPKPPPSPGALSNCSSTTDQYRRFFRDLSVTHCTRRGRPAAVAPLVPSSALELSTCLAIQFEDCRKKPTIEALGMDVAKF